MAKKNIDPECESLARELRSLIPKLDLEGLAFLVEQARVCIYNMQVDKLNKSAIAANAAHARSKSISGKTQAGGKQSSKTENMRIDGAESGSSYYLYYGNKNSMFSRNEMIELVKIANGKGAVSEIGERLFTWFNRERKDVFSTIPFSGKLDARLKILAALLKKNFKVRS